MYNGLWKINTGLLFANCPILGHVETNSYIIGRYSSIRRTALIFTVFTMVHTVIDCFSLITYRYKGVLLLLLKNR